MVGRCRTFHAILAFRQHTWSDDVRHGMPSSPLIAHMVVQHRACHDIITLRHDTRSYYVGRGMPSSPLSSSQGRDMSGEACHHCLWEKDMVRLRRVWHAIIYLGQHIQLKNIERFMLSSSLDFTQSRMTSCMACPSSLGQQTLSDNIGEDIPSSPLDNIQG